MKTETPKTIYLKDYKPYPYAVKSIDLNFDLGDGKTIVTAVSKFVATGAAEALFLNGEDLRLLSIKMNGAELNQEAYKIDDSGLTILSPPASFTLEIITEIYPEQNSRLDGLYQSAGNYCTQCEAEGFRRITYFPDRPDVMTVYSVRIQADKEKYPVLLSNGNLVERGEAQESRHYSVWHDPFPKPCYLFALVAGNLNHIHDTFTTKSGRMVDLYIYVRPGDESQCTWAMESLKRSMKWDEDVYGLEYDLDIFNIVAVSDFNSGAMENKSLNIFNTALVLAHQDTATDADFLSVEGVIAHEYFHNWSGNRVTCRDWFQLSLKEGLTVFRDQEFTADLHSRAVARIDDVTHLRRFQFSEDAGPLAHPIRPEEYIEINNFYTMTVYEKGAEVIRMMRTILGAENYRKGTDLYFKRHDGYAATCEDFVKCMEDASGVDLSQFRLWYSQSGTPEVTFKGEYDAEAKSYTVTLSQHLPPTPGQSDKKPMVIPMAVSLLPPPHPTLPPLGGGKNSEGIQVGGHVDTLILKEKSQTFTFQNIPEKPVPSILRGFTAPVRLKTDLTDDDLKFLMVNDDDGFNRWDSGQTYMLRVLNEIIDGANIPPDFLKTYGDLLDRALDPAADKALMARALGIPDIAIIAQGRSVVDPQAIYDARKKVLNGIVDRFADKLEGIYNTNLPPKDFSVSPEAMGRRALRNTVMLIGANQLTAIDAVRAKDHYEAANTMTDRMAALFLACALRDETIINDFYRRFKSYPLVVDKWFAAQAQILLPFTIEIVKKLKAHPDFNIKNPNRARSLYSAFGMNNPVRFHAADGSGYEFLTEGIIELNAINPKIAARLMTPFKEWRRYTPDRQDKMRDCLSRILKTPNLSPDVFEIAGKSLLG
jgi:aminopeptidase N